MPGLIEMEPLQVPDVKEAGASFSVVQQEVELNLNFTTRKITGWTELTIEPHSRDLRSIRLQSRGATVNNVVVDGKYPVPATSLRYRDPYEGLNNVRGTYGAQQHHLIRENVEDALKDPAESNLVIAFPKQMRIRQMDPLGTGILRVSTNGTADGILNTPLRTAPADDENTMFMTFTVRMDFIVEDTRYALHWAGLGDGDTRYPQVYTTASAVPGSHASFAFPCVGTASSRCAWKITLQVPRTLGDIGRSPRSRADQTDDTQTSDTLTVDVDQKDVEMTDNDSFFEDDAFASLLSTEEKERELVVVATGFMEDSDAPGVKEQYMRKWSFYCETPVAAHHVGFAIAPFERINLAEYRESENEELLKSQAVSIHGFCLPGRAAELRNICMPLTMVC